MRAQLLHLSGPYRGQTITYAQRRLVLGTPPEVDVRFPNESAVVAHHAEIEFIEEGCSFYLRALDGLVFVNRQEVREVILEPGDLIEVGAGGPKVRFRIDYSDGRTCKPVRQMLRDARDVGREGGFLAGTRSIQRDVIRHMTWRDRVLLLGVIVITLVSTAQIGGFVGSRRTAQKESTRREHLAQQFGTRLAELSAQMAVVQEKQARQASREEVEKLRADLAGRAQVVDRMVQQNRAQRQVLDVYTRGVCLVHGRFAMYMPSGDQLIPVQDVDGNPLELAYMGSGFLASGEGHVITNRHVAEPWWNNASVAPLLAQGLVPGFTHLTATFPGHDPIAIDPATIRVSTDGVDVAVFEIASVTAPVLPLASDDLVAVRGGRVIVLGYPTGLNAMLARAEPELVNEIFAVTTDTAGIIAELARRGAISPVITQGALNEVMDRKLVYDAETTSGGSGGPVFGPTGTVIGVNFAITADFDGSNFGVPIQFAQELLP